MLLKNSLHISHELVSKVVQQGDVVIDATMGNGNDTLFLAKLVGDCGKVFAFDVQQLALDNTKKKLIEAEVFDRTELIQDGHQNIDKYIQGGIKAVMFNLGYLPKGDHSIGTRAETTIEAVEKCLELLCKEGIVMIVIYYGGDSGFEEKNAVMEYFKTLDCKKYAVLVHDFVNQVNCPPIAVCIEKMI
ncbi:MAG: SAM-dependent methyltransferase [Clostridiales bacterium GWB2_37_7]|nr:MAG: SAM-dependent methyltransferase [Clostridiales bacterium GWB2_37_7]